MSCSRVGRTVDETPGHAMYQENAPLWSLLRTCCAVGRADASADRQRSMSCSRVGGASSGTRSGRSCPRRGSSPVQISHRSTPRLHA